ncbi:hypothetical protein [Acinetobacter baumannii]|uniref:hypothetical protein n=1 Tax=Acinetobacter baumannii TaxID=470 RepID=UPI000D7309D5|nr:hypothetical protein [Acinetobacter baumannii]MBY8899597.1 hypothetical protein [Acinetobacter baumannii]MBY8907469.1 hypothetical protein [Acinetobacter baumannii]PWX91849.1 hypothetical protein DKM49_16610 [Acinetobacter baumannii]HDV0601005.1 hypothetical protein [Acinetobacter baumannii]HDX5783738.1 hypothetical protein [Acinetobacter baumannii]
MNLQEYRNKGYIKKPETLEEYVRQQRIAKEAEEAAKRISEDICHKMKGSSPLFRDWLNWYWRNHPKPKLSKNEL